MIDIDGMMKALSEICKQYEKTAPAVSQWADDLYMRLQEEPDTIMLGELMIINHLMADGWLSPNHAQNTLYHRLDRLGMSTVGMIDY